jgi:hypothetical protein
MKALLLAAGIFLALPVLAAPPEISIPRSDIDLIKTTDSVDVTGTNSHGGAEAFTVHNAKAIKEFVGLLTSERYNAVPKNLKPDFKSPSRYDVKLSSGGNVVLEFQVIADDVLDFTGDDNFYMESERHSDILLAPLLRLR